MHLRKNRVPLQGLSNKQNNSQLNNGESFVRTFTKIQEHEPKKYRQYKQISTTSAINPKTIRQGQKKISCNINNKENIIGNRTLVSEIRQKYIQKSNIHKILRSWKLDQNGRIKQKQLRTNLSKILNRDMEKISLDQLSEFLTKDNNIGTKQFLDLIYKKPENAYFQTKLYETSEWNQVRNDKINNLIEKLESNPGIGKQISSMNDRQINQLAIQCKRALLKLSRNKKNPIQSSQLLNSRQKQAMNQLAKVTKNMPQQADRVEPCLYDYTRQSSRSNKNQFISVKNKRTESLTKTASKTDSNFFSKDNILGLSTQHNFRTKPDQLNPKSMLGINQTKTRFGSTPKMKTLVLGEQLPKYDRTSSQCVADEQHKTKQYRQNRLLKIREYQQRFNDNIMKVDQKLQNRSNQFLLRKRYDKQAYQYAAYIQNKWE